MNYSVRCTFPSYPGTPRTGSLRKAVDKQLIPVFHVRDVRCCLDRVELQKGEECSQSTIEYNSTQKSVTLGLVIQERGQDRGVIATYVLDFEVCKKVDHSGTKYEEKNQAFWRAFCISADRRVCIDG